MSKADCTREGGHCVKLHSPACAACSDNIHNLPSLAAMLRTRHSFLRRFVSVPTLSKHDDHVDAQKFDIPIHVPIHDLRSKPVAPRPMHELIAEVCDELKEFLLKKNKAYGDSASDPVRVFSSSDTLEQINVRIDDKLSRISRGNEFDGDDTELDLTGYLILKRAIKRQYGTV